MRLRALLLFAILLVPSAWAASPPPATTWSPATSPTITSLAYSADGTTIVVTHPAQGDGGQIPIGQPNSKDITVYDFERGAIWNATCPTTCSGRLAAAATTNGDRLAIGSAATSANLVLLRRETAGYVTSSSGWPTPLTGSVHGVAVSADASVVAAIHGTGDATGLRVFGRDADAKFAFPSGAAAPYNAHQGRLNVVAASANGAWVAVGGAYLKDNATQGVVYLFPGGGASGTPVGFVLLPAPVTSLAINADGTFLVAGTNADSFANIVRTTESGTLARHIFTAPTPVRDVAISATDGQTVAVGHGAGVTLYRRVLTDPDRYNLSRAWLTNLTGGASDVSLSADGKMLLAASGAGGVGFATHLATPLYTLAGSPARAALSADGSRAVFATATTVSAHRHAPAVSIAALDAEGNVDPTPEPASVRPGESAVYRVAVENNGTAPDTIDLVLPQDPNANIVANRTSFTLRPGDRGLATVTVTPGNLLPDTYSLTLRAVGARATQELSLAYTVGAKAGVALVYQGSTAYVVGRSQTVSIDFSVLNVGNDGGSFTLRTTQSPSAGPLWAVNGTPHEATFLQREASAAGRLVVRVPATTPDGASNDIRLVAVMGSGTSLPLDLSFIVNPIIAANMTADARGRLVSPGNAAWFNLTLKNTGSVPATYHVTWEPVERAPPTVAWNSEVTGLRADGTIILNPGDSKPLVVKLFAPQNAPAGATGVLHMQVSELMTGVKRNATITEWLNLSATVVPRDVVTPQSEGGGLVVPGPATVFAIVAVAGAAYVARRRYA